MIHLDNKQDCCGCWACVQRCPKNCISMKEDEEGFLYPVVDAQLCIRCGLCEQVCPVINQSAPQKPIHVYAAKNPDEVVRENSSSGGVFTPLAEAVIAQGGVVFGAKFDADWSVIHGYSETIEGLADFRGSKYVQSKIEACYSQAEEFLKAGREVLFSGTPCQIAGLHRFLRREYSNLLTVDLVCHGVPSPLIWREYLKDLMCSLDAIGKNTVSPSQNTMPNILGIRFRDKRQGWEKYGFEIRWSAFKADKNTVLKSGIYLKTDSFYESATENIFMRGFINNLYLRPSCHACPARQGKSRSDITIADFWGISNYYPEFNDHRGVSLVLVNSVNGNNVYEGINVKNIKTTYEQALVGNYTLEYSVLVPKYRALFWKQFDRGGVVAIKSIMRKMRPSASQRSIHLIKGIVKLIIRRK